MWAVTTCKGRLDHLRQTAPRFAEQFERWCLVDYDCPDASGDWVEQHAFLGSVVERLGKPAKRFHKTRALNLGAARAAREGARVLVFVDADMLIEPGFARGIAERMRERHFLIAGLNGQHDRPGLTGLLACNVEDFRRVGGFNEHFRDWGLEDIEMRLRLNLRGGCTFGRVPVELMATIPHSDARRTEHYPHQNKLRSNLAACEQLRLELKSWGYDFDRLPPAACPLRYQSTPRQGYVLI